ncbi:MAG: UPF0182 family protein [Bryobacteraceae bacterium]|jgi:uncharacterized membrane protein (UPF0182 family)
MVQYRIERGSRKWGGRGARITLIVLAVVLLIAARSLASFSIEYQWWKELGQLDTWVAMMIYGFAPLLAATLIAFGVLWVAHARALKFARTALSEHPLYAWLSSLGLLLLGYMIAAGSIETWTVVRYIGARGIPAEANAWRDAVFGLPLRFYLFDLPFYSDLRGYLLALIIVSVLVYWIAARGWQLRYRLPELQGMHQIDPSIFRLEGGLESRFLRGAMVVFLLALSLRFFLARYEMVYDDHGFMVGIDYVDLHFALPLQWLVIVCCVVAAGLVWMRRWIMAAFMALSLVLLFAVPRLVNSLYVRPNEISIQRPFIDTHIHATRSAYGLERHMTETEFAVHPNAPIDTAAHKGTLDNVRLWDVGAFHNTITQIQALRPYYVFSDTDVDRYMIDGAYREVLLTPRELDINQLPGGSSTSWINPHFVYTHGYGVVLAPVAKLTADGLPVLLIENAPPEIKTPSLKLTRPEIYYGEVVQEPVFVRTAQPEFNYPSGEKNELSRYDGTGGIPISSAAMRVAAAVRGGDINILLSNPITDESRMMIRRNIKERLETLAGFIAWDKDPYLVITDAGRLVWMNDGYTYSDSHPYSRAVSLTDLGDVNYIRNAVKATIDAYDGTTRLYIFAPDDPIIRAYQRLFPTLFHAAAEMPADLRRHARYPETLFRVQAEIYRTYHMLDPQAFYNKEDMWDLARYTAGQEGQPEPVSPTYIVASLPEQNQAEFLLLLPFTPRNKDNLIGLMLARCDGAHLGEIVVLQLSKQELIFGPAQIAARINQEQTISKDLTLWNQQGSHVLRAQTLVLPVDSTLLYVDPIYIQASSASMPQLKKIVLAEGNRLIYTDTYDEAIAQLSGGAQELVKQAEATAAPGAPGTPAAPVAGQSAAGSDPRIARVREHLRRYRELAAQGKWADAGKELEAIEAEVK